MKAKGWRGMGEITICRLARVWGDPWSIDAADIHPPFTVACHPSRGQRRRRFSEGSFMSASSHQRAAERHAGRVRGKHTQAQTHWSYRHVSVHPVGYSVMLYWQLHTRAHTHTLQGMLIRSDRAAFIQPVTKLWAAEWADPAGPLHLLALPPTLQLQGKISSGVVLRK